MNAYHNMSGPPRTKIAWSIRSAGSVLVFGLASDCLKPWFRAFDAAGLADGLRRFEVARPGALAAAVAPAGFVVADVRDGEPSALPDGWSVCADPALALAVVGRMSGNLYVPRRPVRLHPEQAGLWYILPRSEFPRP